MKFGIPTIFYFACGCLMQMGCDVPAAHDTLSPAFIKFDPHVQFTARGFTVEQTKIPGLAGHRASFGWRPFQGSIVLPENSSGCESVAQAVHDALVQAVEGPCHDEIMQPPDRPSGKPFYRMIHYSKDGMRGLVHVWLFPNTTETQIYYAILLHEVAPTSEIPST